MLGFLGPVIIDVDPFIMGQNDKWNIFAKCVVYDYK